jgi:hypothetical protein
MKVEAPYFSVFIVIIMTTVVDILTINIDLFTFFICCSLKKNPYVFAVKYEALANADTAHHILMYGCEDAPAQDVEIWYIHF